MINDWANMPDWVPVLVIVVLLVGGWLFKRIRDKNKKPHQGANDSHPIFE